MTQQQEKDYLALQIAIAKDDKLRKSGKTQVKDTTNVYQADVTSPWYRRTELPGTNYTPNKKQDNNP